MMAVGRHDLSQLYPGVAPAKPYHRASVPLPRPVFGTSVW